MTQTAKAFLAVTTLVTVLLTLAVVVGVFLVLSTSRQQETLDELKDGQAFQRAMLAEAETQRVLLVECLTLPPKPGEELNEADKQHECQQELEGLRALAVERIARTNVYLHECVAETAPDLEVCVTAKRQAKAP